MRHGGVRDARGLPGHTKKTMNYPEGDNDMNLTNNETEALRQFIAGGGSLDDPFLPTRLRRAALDQLRSGQRTRRDEQLAVQAALDNGLGELVTYATTDTEIDAYVTAAEAGAGGPLFGLREKLHLLRGEEAAERLRAQMDYTRIDSRDPFCPTALRETERRVFVGGAFGGPVSVHAEEPSIGNVGESAEERRRIDAIKANLRIEDL